MATIANPRASPLGEVTAKGPVDATEVALPHDSFEPSAGKDLGKVVQREEGEEDDGSEQQVGKEPAARPADDTQTAPPLPAGSPPGALVDDGWEPVWDDNAQAYYFYNRITQATQWNNPRVPEAASGLPGVGNHDREPETAPGTEPPPTARPVHGGYNPAIHGDYDPNASYAQEPEEDTSIQAPGAPGTEDPTAAYAATGAFNRFTGRWQATDINPELHNDENKSKRQMSAYFDVDAAANSHNGKSLKAERSGKKLSKQELRAFKEKRKEKKEEKRRAWLRD